jgi:Tfp pilus assembly protein PilF
MTKSRPNATYDALIEHAHAAVRVRDFLRAEHLAREALGYDPERAAAYNVLAIVRHHRGLHSEAMNLLRAGLAVDPTYQPAQQNLVRFGSFPMRGTPVLGDNEENK